MLLWFVFAIVGMLAIDLGVAHKDPHKVSVREALKWSAIWVALALSFNTGIYFFPGKEPALQFLSGYIVEEYILSIFLIYPGVKMSVQKEEAAVLAISTDPFIVFTSNVFAILGLRSLFFDIAGIVERLKYLKAGLCFVLVFIGVKLFLHYLYKIPTSTSLLIIFLILTASVGWSLWSTRRVAQKLVTDEKS